MASIRNNKGFTLTEILIALAISGIILTAITATFRSQSENYQVQEKVSEMQQNLRVALFSMQRDLRMIGLDPNNTGLFGLENFSYRIMDDSEPYTDTTFTAPPAGFSFLQFTADFDADGVLDVSPGNERVLFRIYDFVKNDNNFDLGRNEGGGLQLLAENIESMGLAFAYDSDNDGHPETYNAGGADRIIWAYTSNDDTTLDKNMDKTGDGVIDENDADPRVNGQGVINSDVDIGPIDISQVYAIRIWLLAKSERRERGFLDQEVYTVGRHVISPSEIPDEINNGGFRRVLLETTVVVRNAAL